MTKNSAITHGGTKSSSSSTSSSTSSSSSASNSCYYSSYTNKLPSRRSQRRKASTHRQVFCKSIRTNSTQKLVSSPYASPCSIRSGAGSAMSKLKDVVVRLEDSKRCYNCRIYQEVYSPTARCKMCREEKEKEKEEKLRQKRERERREGKRER